jgi:hypothetical protein
MRATMWVSRGALAGTLLLVGGIVAAAEEDLPDAEFLEYLGSWEESDEEWLMFDDAAEADETENGERSATPPDGEESTETDDES